MTELASLGAITAFAAGAVSFLSPCVLPLVPAYVSYVTGQSLQADHASAGTRAGAALLSLCFVLGFSTVVIALGASAIAVSRLLLQYRYEAGMVAGALVTAFGLVMFVGVERIPAMRTSIFAPSRRVQLPLSYSASPSASAGPRASVRSWAWS